MGSTHCPCAEAGWDDYRVTINQATKLDPYPLPRVEELFSALSGGKYFTKLDLAHAYLQLPLDEKSQELCTINTHKGLFRYHRLPFGVSSAPAIFQRCMDSLMQGLKNVFVYIDDILVSGASVEDHLATLRKVMERLTAANLRLKKSKCFFLHTSIEYLGHVINEKGIQPTGEKVQAIREMPNPKNVTELRSFLGIINYYGKFLPNLSSRLAPLYKLLCKDARWSWGNPQETAFQEAKKALQTDSLLVHYDPSKPLILAYDASQYGIGAVLSHELDKGLERPIAYISRTLTSAERKYSQLEKEGLAIIFGVTRFHNYLYGRKFAIESDHQPLSYLFNEVRGIPQMASACIQRWALTLSAYSYTIRYKAGQRLANADAFSRLPRPVTTSDDKLPGDLVQLVNHMSSTSLRSAAVKSWTSTDPVLSKVRHYLMTGWPSEITDKQFKPYKQRANELSVLDGCILWGSRVVVPPQGRKSVLAELHETHPGAGKMKSLARNYVWWP